MMFEVCYEKIRGVLAASSPSLVPRRFFMRYTHIGYST